MKRALTGALASTVMMLAFGCSDAPMASDADSALPQFAKGGGKGGPPDSDWDPAIFVLDDNASLYNIRSDAEVRSDPQYTGPQYDDGVCGVMAHVGNQDDAKVFTLLDYKKGREGKVCGDPRGFAFDWDAPYGGECPPEGCPELTSAASMMSFDHVLTVAVGTTELRASQFNDGRCNRLIFNPDNRYDPGNGSDLVEVTRVNADVWIVQTQAYPNDKAWCATDGRLWHMPFSVTITLK